MPFSLLYLPDMQALLIHENLLTDLCYTREVEMSQ